MSSTATQSNLPSTSELVEGALFYPIALVVCGSALPGAILFVPALVLAVGLVIVPLAAVALVVALAAAIVSAPFVLVRAVRGLRERLAESRRKSRRVPRYVPAAG